MNWVQYTFPAISAPHDERDEEELQSWKIELNNVLDQLVPFAQLSRQPSSLQWMHF